ncbi:unnamed protein product [Ascophyllum nodosum]
MGASNSKPDPSVSAKTSQQPVASTTNSPQAPKLGKSGKKICCSCPETKAARDDCVVMNGEDKCQQLIEAHKACLRSEGFDVR